MSSATARASSTAQITGVASQLVRSRLHHSTNSSAASSATRATTFTRKLLLQAMTRHLAVQRAAPQSQRLCRAAEIAGVQLQRALDGQPFELIEIQRNVRGHGG